jgi:hypothetical protein
MRPQIPTVSTFLSAVMFFNASLGTLIAPRWLRIEQTSLLSFLGGTSCETWDVFCVSGSDPWWELGEEGKIARALHKNP